MAKEQAAVGAEYHQRLQGALQAEAVAGLTLLIRLKTAALLVISLWVLSIPEPWPSLLYYESIVVTFLGLQGLHYLIIVRRRQTTLWVPYLVALLEMALAGYAMFVPPPLTPDTIPPQVIMRFIGVDLILVFVVLTVLSYSPFLVLWTGLCAALAWSAGYLSGC